MAEAFNLSPRTLRRNLGEEGTTYRQLLEQLRYELAREYLQNTTLTIDSISQLLGYTESTNFRRAFKRWEGVSPREYRAAHAN